MRTGRPVNEDRQTAIDLGFPTYTGKTHKCGTNIRYTSGGSCVHCARVIATEQREALRSQRANGGSVTIVIDDINEENMRAMLDIPQEMAVEPDALDGEAAQQARRQAAIDELM